VPSRRGLCEAGDGAAFTGPCGVDPDDFVDTIPHGKLRQVFETRTRTADALLTLDFETALQPARLARLDDNEHAAYGMPSSFCVCRLRRHCGCSRQ